jgi:hypothetical protein
MGARLGIADRGQHPFLEHRRHRVLESLGLLVDLVPRDPEHVGEKALDQTMAAYDRLRVLATFGGEAEGLVGRTTDVAVGLEPADHLAHRRGRELHRPGDVGRGHRQLRLLQPEERLQVLLLGDRDLLAAHQLRVSTRGGRRVTGTLEPDSPPG